MNRNRLNSLHFNLLNRGLVFRAELKLTLFYVLLMPLLLTLGYWQLSRADQKTELLEKYQQRINAEPRSLIAVLEQKDANYYRVKLQGRYASKQHFLLDNRVFNGRAGYEVISPFILSAAIYPAATGELQGPFDYVWINRGWVAMGRSRGRPPNIPEYADQLTLIGQVHIPQGKGFILKETPLSGKWPETIQQVNFKQMKARYAAGDAVAAPPLVVRLTTDSEDGFRVGWKPVNTRPEKHLGYAFQWFLMVVVLSILYFHASISLNGGQDE